MTTHVGRLIQDQNLNVHFDGAPVVGKGNESKTQKKGLGGRKALNDISNSGKPSALQPSKKHNSMNVISIGNDLGVLKQNKFSIVGKGPKAVEKAQIGGRKALTDLTNSGMPSAHQTSKKSQDKKLIAVAKVENYPKDVAGERFLHDHKKCIEAQRKAVDMDYFLKTVGLDEDLSIQLASPKTLLLSRNSKLERPLEHLKMEGIPEMMIEDRSPAPSEHNSPFCGSPNSPKPYIHWNEDTFSNFILMKSP